MRNGIDSTTGWVKNGSQYVETTVGNVHFAGG